MERRGCALSILSTVFSIQLQVCFQPTDSVEQMDTVDNNNYYYCYTIETTSAWDCMG